MTTTTMARPWWTPEQVADYYQIPLHQVWRRIRKVLLCPEFQFKRLMLNCSPQSREVHRSSASIPTQSVVASATAACRPTATAD